MTCIVCGKKAAAFPDGYPLCRKHLLEHNLRKAEAQLRALEESKK